MNDCEKTFYVNKEMIGKSDIILNYDGYISKEAYDKEERKILFILKESYTSNIDDFKDSSITKMLCEAINSTNNNNSFGDETGSKHMFDKLAMVSYALLNDKFNFEDIKEEIDKNGQKSLLNVAYVNLSKEPLITSEHNPDKYTDCKNLVKNFEKYKDIVKYQIEQINPDIIVAFGKCDNKGLMELLTELFDLPLEDKNVGETFINEPSE